MSRLLLSVIIPVYNGERWLSEAIDSVLNQDACRLEVIVVDDGCQDRSFDLARSYGDPVIVVRQKNAGPAAARNKGLEGASGDYIGFLDADDVWPGSRVEPQLRLLESDRDLHAVLGMTRCISGKGGLSDPRFFMQLGCGLFRRDAFEKVGHFDSDLRFSEDLDWFTRAREAGLRIVLTDDVTLHHRLHDDNMTRGTDLRELGYFELVKRSLDRRRLKSGTSVPELDPFEIQSTPMRDN